MSSESLPISPERFAKALESLSVSSLHAKAAELRNSITHLEKSNAELEEYVRQEQDKDLYEAILENRDVIRRMEERIELVKKEVTEIRCLPWEPESAKASEIGERPAGNGEGSTTNGLIGGSNGANGAQTQERTNGAPAAADEEEGVFL
ncbi:hypothetical protein BU23DRAFT_214328 [Bimuria novae-zelandiae CBS 107.79]|uniref:Uncharacterized protein n=1 Tax=Bimuria novae-zelandiae CBS 107.79 TaxID=1447943 RepID=A0A6A5V241_9PLEO|nr:hypothetical protein BU23DRAFT_214328 [Bimuria novae-zelandiae CBS 107.79]